KEAIVLKYLSYMIEQSKHPADGVKWYYCTLDKLHEKIPYIPRSSLDDILRKLSKDVLRVANLNRHQYDKTRWFSIPDKDLRKRCHLDPVRYSVQDALDFGIVEAVLLFNL